MGLIYYAPFVGVSMTNAAQDIVFLATSSSVPIIVHSIQLTSANTTDVRASVQLVRRSTAGSGGTGVTVSPAHGRNTVSAATTVTSLRTTPGTVGAVLDPQQWSLLVPYEAIPTPEMRIQVPVSGFLGLHLIAGTGASHTISGRVVFEEL